MLCGGPASPPFFFCHVLFTWLPLFGQIFDRPALSLVHRVRVAEGHPNVGPSEDRRQRESVRPPLDTFREMPPDARDVQRLGERFGARYIMLLFCVSGVQQKGKTEWFEVRPGARVLGADPPHTYATAARPSQSEDLDIRISRVVRAALGYGRSFARTRADGREPRRRSRVRGKGDNLVRELIEQQKEQHRAELARIEEHHRELREQEQRHQEEVRRLERERQEEINRRLEEKISEAGSRRDEEPADFNTKLLDFAMKKLESGDEEGADSLVNIIKGEAQGAGGFWGFAREVIEVVREDPKGALQAVSTVMPGLFRGQPQQPAAAQQQPQQPAAPVSREQLTDAQIVGAVAAALGNAIVSDADPTPYAQEVRDILEERPHLRGQLEMMLAQADEDLLSTISSVARVSFDSLGRRPVWASCLSRFNPIA